MTLLSTGRSNVTSISATRPPFLATADRASASHPSGGHGNGEGSSSAGSSYSHRGSQSHSTDSSSTYDSYSTSTETSSAASSDILTPSPSLDRSSSIDVSASRRKSEQLHGDGQRTPSTETLKERQPEKLLQIVYTSSSRNRYLSPASLQSILAGSRKRNAQNGITGLLLYRDGSFAQFLEGPEAAVRSTFDKIQADSRHRGVIVVLQRSIERRDFETWRMGYRDLDYNMAEENHDEFKGQVGKRGASIQDAREMEEAKSCLVDLATSKDKE